MKKITGWMTSFALALALAVPAFTSGAVAADKGQKADKAAGAATTEGTSAGMSKDEADKLKDHNKLRGQITKVKYPATKNDIVAKVKGIKADDKKWFSDTLPDKTYESADDVFSALGWEANPAPAAAK